jgi:hypothetical protein
MKLKTIQFPNGLEVIKEYAFQGCTKLKHVIFPEGLLLIEIGKFNGCSSLKRIMIPSSVIYLGQYSFKDCMQLDEVIINNHGLRNILDETFSGCTSLKTVNIPSLVMDISWSAFSGCDNPSLSLIYPHEIINFIGGYNISWWNVCTIQYQVQAYSFIQSRNVVTCLSLIQALSQDSIIELFSRRIHIYIICQLPQNKLEELFCDDLHLVDTLMMYYEHIEGFEEFSLLPETVLTLILSFLVKDDPPARFVPMGLQL